MNITIKNRRPPKSPAASEMFVGRSHFNKFLAALDDIKSWQVACLFLVLGFAIFWSGLNGGFQGDDNLQIVENVAVHSLDNVPHYFKSSTFWNGETLVGSFYRPMMTTTFAFIYAVSGANSTAFHVVQLLLYVGGVFVLYLFMKRFFRPAFAIAIAMIFMVHPINSQAVYAIPSMQEPLFFLFGMLALLRISRSQTAASLAVASGFLLLSLLSKETGIVFVALATLYLILFHRGRVITFCKIVALPIALYLMMRSGAVGLFQSTVHAAPISDLSFIERMMSVPSIIVFYLAKILWPAGLATSYYWTQPSFSWTGVFIPLVLTMVFVGAVVCVGRYIRMRSTIQDFKLYLFFAIWALLGILPYLHVIPLDMTACEPWLYSSLVGPLGMTAVALRVLLPKRYLGLAVVVILVMFAGLWARTTVRGFDYESQYSLASVDIAVSSDNYLAMNNLAQSLIRQDELGEAAVYAERSTVIYPAVTNYTNLGVIKQKQGDFIGAKASYEKALTYGSLGITYENLGMVSLIIGKADENIVFFKEAIEEYPRNNKLWTYLAMEQAASGAETDAKQSITSATSYGSVPPALYYAIMTESSLGVTIPGSTKTIRIP